VRLQETHQETEADEYHYMHILEGGVVVLDLFDSNMVLVFVAGGPALLVVLGEEAEEKDDYDLADHVGHRTTIHREVSHSRYKLLK
jgi:hypothetical protein